MVVSKKIPRKSLPVVFLAALVAALYQYYLPGDPGAAAPGRVPGGSSGNASDAILDAAFRDRANDLQVHGDGTVVHVLPDDNKGSRHQRFLLETGSGLTLLVAHNIDLAPRIPNLERGDRVGFYGEYEWNEKGGVIHWTHHDPGGRHVDGWLERGGQRFE